MWGAVVRAGRGPAGGAREHDPRVWGGGERKREREKALGPVVESARAGGGGETHGNGPFCGVCGPPSSLWELPAELRALSNPSSFSRSGCSLGELSGHPLPPLAPRGHQPKR